VVEKRITRHSIRALNRYVQDGIGKPVNEFGAVEPLATSAKTPDKNLSFTSIVVVAGSQAREYSQIIGDAEHMFSSRADSRIALQISGAHQASPPPKA